MIFRLALEMGRTVRELLGAMDSRELSEWMAFDVVEPIGGRRGDIQAAIVASTIANVNRGKGKKALQPADFIPEYGRTAEAASLETWLGQRIAEKAWEPDASGETAAAGDDPDQDDNGERLRGAGGELDSDAHGDGVGGTDAAAGGDA